MVETDDPDDPFILDRRREPTQSPLVYGGLIVAIVLIVVTAIVLIAIFKPESRDAITQIVGFVGPALLVLITMMKQLETQSHVTQLREALNGHLQRVIEKVRQEEFDKGTRAPRIPRPGQRAETS